MNDILDIFKAITKIPHGSHNTAELKDYLVNFFDGCGIKANVDEVGNIHVIKGTPKICLQAHYDMVFAGDAPKIDVYEENGWIMAKNSTLGADDGIGLAIAMKMIKEVDNLEILFTNDEEVGLIGASGFKGNIISDKLLNLDSENDEEVIIGCAGGVDVWANMKLSKSKKRGKIYNISITDLPGGHSGIEIAKNIPSAIKELGKFIKENNAELIEISGGERLNCIPVNAYAKILCSSDIKMDNRFKIENLGEGEAEVLDQSKEIIGLINSFAQGVRAYNEDVHITQDSINLAIIKEESSELKIGLFARSMSQNGLDNVKFETKSLFEGFGFDIKFEFETKPWEPIKNDFNEYVLNVLKEFKPNAEIKAIHAGLECGAFLDMKPTLKACSIGPNIFGAHTIKERCEIASIDIIYKVVDRIVKKYQ